MMSPPKPEGKQTEEVFEWTKDEQGKISKVTKANSNGRKCICCGCSCPCKCECCKTICCTVKRSLGLC